MNKNTTEALRDKVCGWMEELAHNPNVDMNDLPLIHKLADTLKNLDKICLLEEEGGGLEARDDYGRGSSYANRGEHYVRGHYSRDDGTRRGRDDARYSRGDGRSAMLEHLEMAFNAADGQDRDAIRRMMQNLQNA